MLRGSAVAPHHEELLPYRSAESGTGAHTRAAAGLDAEIDHSLMGGSTRSKKEQNVPIPTLMDTVFAQLSGIKSMQFYAEKGTSGARVDRLVAS